VTHELTNKKNNELFLTNSDIYFVTRWNSIKKKRDILQSRRNKRRKKEEERYKFYISKCINS